MLHIPGLYILENDKGRAIYTAQDLATNDLIEICPIIKITVDEIPLIDQTIIHDYYFIWDENTGEACLPLGYGCLYNHSKDPNATVVLDYQDDHIKIEAIKPISKGEEITIDYTGGHRAHPLWFKPNP